MSDWPDLLAPPEVVAPLLLGAVVRHGAVALRLTEVEAYAGTDDPASHAGRGPTPRCAIMFGPAGRLYCYLSFGVHVCANLVVGPSGSAGAVLLRAGEVVEGVSTARERRPGVVDTRLARGPGCLARALDLRLSDNGADLSTGPITLERGAPRPQTVRSGPRVGVRLAAERPWRFWEAESSTVSAYRRSPRAPHTPEHP